MTNYAAESAITAASDRRGRDLCHRLIANQSLPLTLGSGSGSGSATAVTATATAAVTAIATVTASSPSAASKATGPARGASGTNHCHRRPRPDTPSGR